MDIEVPEEQKISSNEDIKTSKFQPRILGFLCNWCSYAASDLAGISRIQLPPTMRIIRVMCTGSIDPALVFEAYENGIDGVVIMGCHFGDCHYLTGNLNAEKKVNLIKLLLAKTDIEPERFHLEWVSAAEGPKFAEVVKGFTQKIASLGPNPLFENGKANSLSLRKLLGAKHASEAFKLRAVVGRWRRLTEEGNIYGEKVPADEYNKWMMGFVEEQYIRSRIMDAVRTEPKTVQELAEDLALPPKVVFVHVGRLWKKQMILPVGHKGISPTYSIAEGV